MAAQARPGAQVPRFEVDRLWPKPLPKMWILGSSTALPLTPKTTSGNAWWRQFASRERKGAGAQASPEHVLLRCATGARVRRAGNLLSEWAAPGRATTGRWSARNCRRFERQRDHRRLSVRSRRGSSRSAPGGTGGRKAAGQAGSAASARCARHQFTRTGQFVWQFGKPATVEGNNGTTTLSRPAGFDVDEAANEVYIADGLGNRRVVVVDAGTGAYKRHLGRLRRKPDDTAPRPTTRTRRPTRRCPGSSRTSVA